MSLRSRLLSAGLVSAAVWVIGASLGLTDDEAYYWAISHHVTWGFIYHPPMTPWIYAGLRGLGLPADPWALRIPAAFVAGFLFFLSSSMGRAGGVLYFGLVGLFALGWMVVPDTPFLLGWGILLWSLLNWERTGSVRPLLLFSGVAVGCAAKISFPAHVACAMLGVLWSGKGPRKKILLPLSLGVAVGCIPVLIWYLQHDFQMLRYQFSGRHSEDALSLLRWGRFVLSQVLFVSPILIFLGFKHFGRFPKTLVAILAPMFVLYGLQPLRSEFKFHWLFPAYFGLVIGLAYLDISLTDRFKKIYQASSGAVIGLILLALFFPMGALTGVLDSQTRAGRVNEISNDLYGWEEAGNFVAKISDAADGVLPIFTSRYQTAGQIAFAIRDASRVSLFPLRPGEESDWPKQRIEEFKEILHVRDERYDQALGLLGWTCISEAVIEPKRYGISGKKIQIDRCRSNSSK